MYDTVIEVKKDQYKIITNNFCGVIAHNQVGEKYFIKIWITKYSNQIMRLIEKTK